MHPLIFVLCVFNGFMQNDDRMGTDPIDASTKSVIPGSSRDSVVTQGGRIFVSYPGGDGNGASFSLGEMIETGETVPYPDSEWNRRDSACDPCAHFRNVRCLVIDGQDFLWVLDGGDRVLQHRTDNGAKLIQISLRENHVVRVISLDELDFPPVCNFETIRVDEANHVVYVSDSGANILLVVDLERGKSPHFQSLSTLPDREDRYDEGG